MKIALSAEDTVDLTPEYLTKWGIHTCHFHVEKGGEQFRGDQITNEECWEYTNQTGNLCHTSAVNIDECAKHFAELKKTYDKIIHITISSGISSGYPNAVAAANGDPDIYVVDSRFTSGKIAMLLLYAKELIAQGKSFEEICKAVEERKAHTEGSFLIDTLFFLYKGGRCSKLAAFGANVLKLHPVILADDEGKFTTGKKYRGKYHKCMIDYIKDLLKDYPNIDKKMCFFNYASATPELLKDVEKTAKDFGFEQVYLFKASPINSYHSGPNAAGFMFFYDI
ncbi:MAG: DegV family protein [Bacillota bacterium]|nr:DegV family protein [Bacillota bacterium]